MKAVITKVTLASLSAATMFCAGALHASPLGDHSVTRTETVKYMPSALDGLDGATKLYTELQAAAERVCRDPDYPFGKSLQRDEPARVQCVKDALARAVRRVDMPMITYLHQDSGQSRTAALR